MRARTLLMTASLALVALSLPPAQAVESAMPGCHTEPVSFEGPFGTNTVEQEHNCRVHVTLNEDIVCPGANVEETTVEVSGNTVTYFGCGDPDQGGGLGDPVASSSSGHCPPDVELPGSTGLYFRDDCSPDPHADVTFYCLSGGGGSPKKLVSFENVTVAPALCAPDLPTVASTSSNHCPDDVEVLPGIALRFRDDCSADPHVWFGTYCIGGGNTKTVYDRENVTIFYTHCTNALPPIAVTNQAPYEPQAQCPGIATAYPWSEYVDVTVGPYNCNVSVGLLGGFQCPFPLDGSTSRSVGTVTVGANCTPAVRTTTTSAAPCSAVPGSPLLNVSDDCTEIEHHPYDCFWGGHYHDVQAGPVSASFYHCGPV